MRDGYEKLQELGVEVYGVSFDSPEDNLAWHQKHGFPFKLLSDKDRKMAVAYGAADDTGDMWADRISYVIDADGTVLLAYPKVSPSTHFDVVLADLLALGGVGSVEPGAAAPDDAKIPTK